MLRCSVKYSKPRDLAFPSVHRLSEHATAAQDDLRPAIKKNLTRTPHTPGTGLFTRSVWRKYVPPFFLVLVVVTISRNHPNTPWFHRRCFGYNSNPPSKQNQKKKRVLNSHVFFLRFWRLQISMLCHSSIINQTHFVICFSGVTASADLIFQAAKSLRWNDWKLISNMWSAWWCVNSWFKNIPFLCVCLKTSWCQNSILHTSKYTFVDPLFPYFCMTKKNHPPNTHHPLKWPDHLEMEL